MLRNSGLSENDRINCAFHLLCLKVAQLEDAWEEELLAVVLPRPPERHLSNLTSSLFLREWLTAILVRPVATLQSRDRPQVVPASGRQELGSGVWLLARLGQPKKCGCRFYTRCSTLFMNMMADQDAFFYE